MKKSFSTLFLYKRGFTLIELLIVVAIITILSAVGMVMYNGIQKNAKEAKIKADIDVIVKVLEVNYDNNTDTYNSLEDSFFSSGSIPIPPGGGSYTVNFGADNESYQVCAALDGGGTCSTPSGTCYCKTSSRGEYIAQGGGQPTPTPTTNPTATPTPIPTSTPTPTPTPTPVSYVIKVYALGTQELNIYPNMELRIDDVAVASYTVNGTLTEYSYSHPTPVTLSQVKVAFTNDYRARDLRVDKINLNGVDFQTEHPSTISTGYWNGTSCATGYFQTEWINCSGYFQYSSN